jgi:hypothetical protein
MQRQLGLLFQSDQERGHIRLTSASSHDLGIGVVPMTPKDCKKYDCLARHLPDPRAALPAVLSSVWLDSSLCHDAAAAAFTTAQTFHVGRDWRIRVEAETS